jgi:hypothetical protein
MFYWIPCGAVAWILTFFYYRRRFPTVTDWRLKASVILVATILGLTGPAGLLVIVLFWITKDAAEKK